MDFKSRWVKRVGHAAHMDIVLSLGLTEMINRRTKKLHNEGFKSFIPLPFIVTEF
jgi:hypothetical protein